VKQRKENEKFLRKKMFATSFGKHFKKNPLECLALSYIYKGEFQVGGHKISTRGILCRLQVFILNYTMRITYRVLLPYGHGKKVGFFALNHKLTP
jgi:hypothetical protein